MLRLVSILCFFLLIFSRGSAQYLFDNLNQKEGLSSREIRALLQDSEGFIWMGAMNGLDRFDGNNFVTWNRSSLTYPSSLGTIVSALAEHGKGIIWVGTNTGIGRFDKATQQFKEATINTPLKNKRPYISQLRKDKTGRLWMSTYGGVYIEKNGNFDPVSSVYPFARVLDSITCYHSGFVYDSTRNVFWIASTIGLFCLDLEKKQLISAANNPEQLPIYNNHLLNSVAIEKNGDIWVGDITEDALWHYSFDSKQLEKITRINGNPLWVLTGGANNLLFDKEGRLWISTWLFTSFIRYPDGRIEMVPYDYNVPYSIGYGLVNDAIQDSYGNIWLATINGVSKLAASRFVENIIKVPTYPFFFTTGFANADAMQTDNKGNWWIGKMEGLVQYDTATRRFERFAPLEDGHRWNEVVEVDIINDEVWCSTYNGIQIFNPRTKKFRLLEFPGIEGITVRPISWVYPDSRGYVWTSVWNDGVYRFNLRTKEWVRFDGSLPQWSNFKPSFSLCALETSYNTLWITNARTGLRLFDYASQQFRLPVDSLLLRAEIVSMTEDPQHYIWLTTAQNGILKCNANGKVLDSITHKDGLPHYRFTDLFADASGRLWAITLEALIAVQPSTKQVTKVDIDVTFSFNNHWNSLILKNNKLYATMLDNVLVIDPAKFKHDFTRTPPLISAFRVFEKNLAFNSNEAIRLNYTENFFSIDFSSPFHREDASIQYAYKLEGFDKEWVYCGRRQTAAYTNVPNGNYNFLVKTTDGKGNWSQEMRVLTIFIRPPFWKTWWFASLAFLSLIVLFTWLWKTKKKRQRKQQLEKTIDYFANSVYGENSVNEICWDIARNCISQLQFEDCVVYLLDEKTGHLVQNAAYGPKNPKGHEIVDPLEIELGKGIVGSVAATAKSELIHDTSKDSRYIVDDERRFSELAVPILHDGKVIGVIDSEHPRKHFFTEEHLKVMTTIASISANKIAEAQAEEYARENEIKLLEIRKMLAESQLMALRAQMNPHFVFNCLNSIQECIVTQKYGEASKYLNKFSKLFRMVLNNSGKNLVTLSEEKEVLELYLELEQMRFEKSFSWEMIVDEDLEADEILIPSMLLQPYVENALWHGLMHKEGERKLVMEFRKINEEVFRCTIDDNGIGRKRSYELKAQQSKAKRHESKGLKISRDRIEVLQKQGFHATLDITDKYDAGGESTGTTITIELSTFLKN
jgi:ligand-binding sensor domain-containing protein/putative methionine-R-sulfoxide reductase with GAF domain